MLRSQAQGLNSRYASLPRLPVWAARSRPCAFAGSWTFSGPSRPRTKRTARSPWSVASRRSHDVRWVRPRYSPLIAGRTSSPSPRPWRGTSLVALAAQAPEATGRVALVAVPATVSAPLGQEGGPLPQPPWPMLGQRRRPKAKRLRPRSAVIGPGRGIAGEHSTTPAPPGVYGEGDTA